MQDNTGLKKKKNFFFLLQNCKGKKKVHKSTTASQKLSSHQQDHFKEQKDPFPHPVRALPSAETLNEKCCLSTQPPSHPRPSIHPRLYLKATSYTQPIGAVQLKAKVGMIPAHKQPFKQMKTITPSTTSLQPSSGLAFSY